MARPLTTLTMAQGAPRLKKNQEVETYFLTPGSLGSSEKVCPMEGLSS